MAALNKIEEDVLSQSLFFDEDEELEVTHEEEPDDSRHDNVGDRHNSLTHTPTDVPAYTRDSVDDLWARISDIGTSAFGSPEMAGTLDVMDDQGDSDSSHFNSEEFSNPAQIYLSEPVRSKRRRIKEARLERLDENDFEEGAPRRAFILLRDRVRACFLKKISPRERIESMDWVFTYQVREDKITFDLCCDVLLARPSKLRMRLQYEFWRRWVVLSGSMGFMTAVLPEEWMSRALYVAGDHGVQLAGMIWRWPSIPQSTLQEYALGKGIFDSDVKLALERMSAAGLVQGQGVNLYLTGRGKVEFGERLGF